MKTFISVLVAIAALAYCGIQIAEAKEYKAAKMSEGALKAACKRGGGAFNSGDNDYSCSYKNGNLRDCSKKTGECIVITPK